jgi:hypothetical protein
VPSRALIAFGSLCAEARQRAAAPFPAPLSRLLASFLRFAPDRFHLTIPISFGNIECQRRFAPTPDQFPPGMVIGFPPESLIALSGILIQCAEERRRRSGQTRSALFFATALFPKYVRRRAGKRGCHVRTIRPGPADLSFGPTRVYYVSGPRGKWRGCTRHRLQSPRAAANSPRIPRPRSS